VLRVSGDRLDHDYLERWAPVLGVADSWRALLTAERDPPNA
jgi:hypothetical protein